MTENITSLLELIEHMESDLKKIKALANKLHSGKKTSTRSVNHDSIVASAQAITPSDEQEIDVTVVEGIFDGYFMIWSDSKKYPVPMNYSSKSKLVQGDHLKLRIKSDGALLYKVIKPAERKFVKATLVKHNDGRFQAVDESNKLYNLNQAAVTFFTGETGNEMSLIVPLDSKADYAAIETIIK